MERVILMQNPHWKGKIYPNINTRNLMAKLIENLSLPHIQALTGIRRCGKSTIFKLLINQLMENVNPAEILFINLEDPVFQSAWSQSAKLYDIIEVAEKLSGSKTRFLFLDEVQIVDKWEHFVKSVYDSKLYSKIFVTGSNSSLLSGDYADLLSGRYTTDHIYPYSFEEILKINNINTEVDALEQKSTVLKLLDSSMEGGCFPEIQQINNASLKREVLISYFDTITMKDCIIQHNIRDSRIFRHLTLYLLNNVANVFSYHSLGKAVNLNENTTKTYLNALFDSYIMSEIQNFSFSIKANARPKNKTYCSDNGIMHAVGANFSPERGRLFENLVFCELQKKGFKDIYFYNEENECDFIVKTPSGLIAIQAVYELNAYNMQREIKGIESVKQKFGISQAFIITLNQADLNKEIPVLPFWNWCRSDWQND